MNTPEIHGIIMIILSASVEAIEWPKVLQIGLLVNSTLPEFYVATAEDAIRELKELNLLPKSLELKFHIKQVCDDASSIDAVLQLMIGNKESAYIGPECSTGMRPVGLIASNLDLPIFNYASRASDFADKRRYNTLVTSMSSSNSICQAIASMLRYYDWFEIVIIFEPTPCAVPLSALPEVFRQANISVLGSYILDFQDSDRALTILRLIKATTRIILLCPGENPATALRFLQTATEAGFATPDYVYILPRFWSTLWHPWEPWLASNLSLQEAKQLAMAYRRTLLVAVDVTSDIDYLLTFLLTKFAFNKTDFNNDSLNRMLEDIVLLGDFRNAVTLYGVALHKAIEYCSECYSKGSAIFNASRFLHFKGNFSTLRMDANATRCSDYHVSKVQFIPTNDSFEYKTFLKLSRIDPDESFKLEVATVDWGTKNNEVPTSRPKCGFFDERCHDTKIKLYTWSIILIAFSVIILLILITWIYIRKSISKRASSKHVWKLNFDEIQKLGNRELKTPAILIGSLSSRLNHSAHCSSNHSRIEQTNECIENDERSTYLASFKNQRVVVKTWAKKGPLVLDQELLNLLTSMKETQHENLNQFIGFSLDDNRSIGVVWAYEIKGNLHDILNHEIIKLDESFYVAMIRDIGKGLEFIHATQSIWYHGKLYSTSCLVDRRWVTKISDFGVSRLEDEMIRQKVIEKSEEDDVPAYYKLCTAPEILRNCETINYQRADVYQYAMIIYEIIFRRTPFDESTLTNQEIIESIVAQHGPNFRPKIMKIGSKDLEFLRPIIQKCWSDNPALRPTILNVNRAIASKTKQYGKNLIDHIMKMLERYTADLEGIVAERTEQLNEEKKRSDELLYQILPRSVADALKAGRTVEPELFDTSSIFFSDIVGFTTICSTSHPREIVAMLNGLYSQFDALILRNNAYKVETIGDAYLVVSGVPVRNGAEHVVNIANLSLGVIQAIHDRRIPHMPQQALSVRIGLHSGNVAAGVVGLTMPRYCLFGDSVNFASRMESNGEGGKIHISENMYQSLRPHPEYITQLRGDMEIKGKGLCRTYWLIGKMNLTMPTSTADKVKNTT